LIGSAISSFTGQSGFGIKRATSNEATSKDKTPAKYGEALRKSIVNSIPLKTSGSRYEYLDRGWTVGYVGKDPFKLGFVGSSIAPKIEETMVFGVERIGRGNVTYMVDNPLFRSFWENGKFLFSNAVFFL